MELVFLCLGWGWLFARSSKRFRRFLDIYQPDEFATQFAILRKHLRNLLFQDANSIYSGLLVWILFIITALHHLKNLVRNSVEQEVALNRYQAVLFFLKPTVTIATGCVTIACHIFNNWGRLDKWAAAFGTFRLLWLAANLAFVEVVFVAPHHRHYHSHNHHLHHYLPPTLHLWRWSCPLVPGWTRASV